MTKFDQALLKTAKVAGHMALVAAVYLVGTFLANSASVPSFVTSALSHVGIPAAVIGLVWTFLYQYTAQHQPAAPTSIVETQVLNDVVTATVEHSSIVAALKADVNKFFSEFEVANDPQTTTPAVPSVPQAPAQEAATVGTEQPTVPPQM